MLNILCSSIARAGGIEMPPDVRIVPEPTNRSALILSGGMIRALGQALCRLGDRVAAERVSSPRNPAVTY